MDDRWYHYFLVAARLEHVGKASEELGISQPALSRCIARIEEEYGARLFDRSGRNVQLNAAGRVLQQRIGTALGELEDARREVHEMKIQNQRTVTIGFLATFGASYIPAMVNGFRNEAPDVRIRLLQGSQPALQRLVSNGDIDLCISSPRFADAKIQWRPLFNEELVLLVYKGHPFAGRDLVEISDIAGEQLVALKTGYGLRHYLDDVARAGGFQPQIVFETDEVATLIGFVGAGLGLTLAPVSAPINPDTTVRIRIDPPFYRTVGLSWRTGRYVSEVAQKFRNYILASAEGAQSKAS